MIIDSHVGRPNFVKESFLKHISVTANDTAKGNHFGGDKMDNIPSAYKCFYQTQTNL
jgi:hypothetical protein